MAHVPATGDTVNIHRPQNALACIVVARHWNVAKDGVDVTLYLSIKEKHDHVESLVSEAQRTHDENTDSA